MRRIDAKDLFVALGDVGLARVGDALIGEDGSVVVTADTSVKLLDTLGQWLALMRQVENSAVVVGRFQVVKTTMLFQSGFIRLDGVGWTEAH